MQLTIFSLRSLEETNIQHSEFIKNCYLGLHSFPDRKVKNRKQEPIFVSYIIITAFHCPDSAGLPARGTACLAQSMTGAGRSGRLQTEQGQPLQKVKASTERISPIV